MNTQKKKSIIPWLLGITALIIWGHNGYKIFSDIFKSDEVKTFVEVPDWKPQIITSGTKMPSEFFVYQADYRNPFKNWLRSLPLKKVLKSSKSKKVKSLSPKRPFLRLTGILKDTSGLLALIEDPNGDVFFIRKGDKITGVKIIGIDSKSVSCCFEKQEYRLVLRR